MKYLFLLLKKNNTYAIVIAQMPPADNQTTEWLFIKPMSNIQPIRWASVPVWMRLLTAKHAIISVDASGP
jgi:hypothetical protein